MRKTRLVILPTKCLHQMGFLLLFLSCPVIGDWGRIRPESEDSHNAIQIDREGTCGLERDPPGGLVKFLDEDGSKQCRLSEDLDTNTVTGERRVDVRRMTERRVVDERRGVRSRSVEARRVARGDMRTRSLSVGRMERSASPRNAGRRETERFQSSRQLNDRRSEQRRLSIDRREHENRRERETTRLVRLQERERQDVRRERSIQEQSRVKENEARRQERSSPVRRELNERRTENRRRSLESIARKPETRRDTNNLRRLAATERNIRERRSDVLMEREAKTRRDTRFVPEIEYKKAEGLFAGVTKQTELKSYDGFNVGDWTTNCVIGAVVYFFTTRQIKSV